MFNLFSSTNKKQSADISSPTSPSSSTIEIMGGLGNQLFQIYTLLAYSLQTKTPFYFPAQPIKVGARKTTYWHTPLLKNLKKFLKDSNKNKNKIVFTYQEPHFHYQPLPPTYEKNLHFVGTSISSRSNWLLINCWIWRGPKDHI